MDRFRLKVDAQRSVSALLLQPSEPKACFVFAHGAGAGMTHPFMEAVAQRLYEHSIATLRYQFPYMEARIKRPDPPPIAHAAVRAAVNAARERLPGVRLIAGGKSFGARMTSQTQAASPLPDVRALAFFGFPLHPSGKPSTDRAAHLAQVTIPMLFLQGTRDKLAELSLVTSVIQKLGTAATLYEIDGGDHSFHVPAKSGRKDDEIINEAARKFSQWVEALQP
jgi:uncharacterized protein